MTTVETTTTTTEADTERAAYLAAVERALAAVPEAERQELLDDLADHLTELAAEGGPALAERLGPPDRYAAELVASAGIELPEPPAPAAPRDPLTSRATSAARRAWTSPTAAAVRDFLPELRPGWWVLRAWAVLALLAVLVGEGPVYPLPDVFGNVLLDLAALGAAVVASVTLARRGRWPDRALTWVAALGMVVALANGTDDGGTTDDIVYDPNPGVLTTADGRHVTNIWPVGADGEVIEGVFLFDQDGVPIEVGDLGLTRGVVLPGLYPQAQVEQRWDDMGNVRDVPVRAPDVQVPQLPGSTTTTSTTVPAATSTTVPPATPPPAGQPGS